MAKPIPTRECLNAVLSEMRDNEVVLTIALKRKKITEYLFKKALQINKDMMDDFKVEFEKSIKRHREKIKKENNSKFKSFK